MRYKELRQALPGAKPAPTGRPPAQNFKYIGGYLPRVDGELIVTGAAAYTHDLHLEGLLTG